VWVGTVTSEALAQPGAGELAVLRSIANAVRGLNVEPQRLITTVQPWARPDLVDEDLGIVLEADACTPTHQTLGARCGAA
jgi:hypothetical protein